MTQVLDDPTLDEALDDVEEAPRERLSLVRLALLIGIIALIAGGIFALVRKATTTTAPIARSWSIPYVDVTLTPTYDFQNPQSNPARDIALAFVVADPDEPCTPSWGGAYQLDEAGSQLELDRRIRQLRAAGGDIVVSFGGQSNQELAYACDDQEALTSAYRSVIERYDLESIDLDIENADLADAPSIGRRATAIATLQHERAANGNHLTVWLTLPVATSGLTDDGVELVRAMIAGGVDVSGVNAMTMNFGDAAHPTTDMLAAAKSALEATARQVGEIYASQGTTLSEQERWARTGATPMIGQNDVDGEVFTLDDAAGLADFAVTKGLGRVSIWSINRDAPCSDTFQNVMVLSNTCSSVEQEPLAFARAFSTLPGGSAGQATTVTAVTVPDQSVGSDDQATSPFPIWRPDADYPQGYKVVRNGQVYQAKWYTSGQDPAAATASAWDTPWTLVGPVSPDDPPFAPQTVAPDTYPAWQQKTLYALGDRVLFEGLPYEARWPNQAEPPSTKFPVGPDSAWEPLFTVPGEPGT